MILANSGGMGMGAPVADAVNHLVREDHTTASDDRRRSQMKATFAAANAAESDGT